MAKPADVSSPIGDAFVSEQGMLAFGWAGGVLLFAVLSGCAIAVLPFSIFAQLCVVLHTFVGSIAVLVFSVWQLRHWRAARNAPRTRSKVCAYTGFWLLVASAVTGLAVAGQALFGRYVASLWDSLHLWTGILALPFVAYHLWPSATVIGADPAPASDVPPPNYGLLRRRMWQRATLVTVFLFAICGVLTFYSSREQKMEAANHDVGEAADFQPSMVDTETGRPVPLQRLADSESCGTSDCHASIYKEWQASAHRWSAEDEFFQEVRTVTTRAKGVRETEKCGACHDPVSMLSGHKDPMLGRSAPGFSEGDSCVVCHAVRKVDDRGIGSYVLGAPRPYLWDSHRGRYARLLNHFLLRSYPEQHNRDYRLTLPRKPESCAPCHKEFDLLDEREGPVQVETQYDDWKRGKWNTDADPSRRLYCQQCHMYLVTTARADADPYDLKKQFGIRHRNHSFAAGNQYMPVALAGSRATPHSDRVVEWLRGERVVPEIEKVWPRGPIVELKIEGPPSARTGNEVEFQITLSNKKVGHGFPTGPLNIARAWIEVVVQDSQGGTVFHSGWLDDANHIEAGSYILKPLAINSAGQMVMRPDLWHPVGPQFRPAVLAGESATYDYRFRVPPRATGALTVKARLRYAKANQFFMDAVYPAEHREPPVTDISSAQVVIQLTH